MSHATERVHVLRQDVVVDDHPLGLRGQPPRPRSMMCVDAPGAAMWISRAQLRFTDAGHTTR